MEPSKFVAIRPCLDEAIRRIDAYLNWQQEAKKNAAESWAASQRRFPNGEPLPEEPSPVGTFSRPVTSEPVDDTPVPFYSPYGFSLRRKPAPWNEVCQGWPADACKAAAVLRELGQTEKADGIDRELQQASRRDSGLEPLEEYGNVTKKAARQVREILEAIIRDAPGGPQAAPDDSAWVRSSPTIWRERLKTNKGLEKFRDSATPTSSETGVRNGWRFTWRSGRSIGMPATRPSLKPLTGICNPWPMMPTYKTRLLRVSCSEWQKPARRKRPGNGNLVSRLVSRFSQ